MFYGKGYDRWFDKFFIFVVIFNGRVSDVLSGLIRCLVLYILEFFDIGVDFKMFRNEYVDFVYEM